MTIKIGVDEAEYGENGEKLLIAGEHSSMRHWREDAACEKKFVNTHYETIGFVISGEATLEVAGKQIDLSAGDSWKIPQGAAHSYSVRSGFEAVEVCSPGKDR